VPFTINDIAPLADIDLDPEFFQKQWEILPESAKLTRILARFPSNINEKWIEDAFALCNMYCIASGEQDNELKFYFYSKYIRTNSFIFMELSINKGTEEFGVVVKTENEEVSPYFVKYVESCFKNWNLL